VVERHPGQGADRLPAHLRLVGNRQVRGQGQVGHRYSAAGWVPVRVAIAAQLLKMNGLTWQAGPFGQNARRRRRQVLVEANEAAGQGQHVGVGFTIAPPGQGGKAASPDGEDDEVHADAYAGDCHSRTVAPAAASMPLEGAIGTT